MKDIQLGWYVPPTFCVSFLSLLHRSQCLSAIRSRESHCNKCISGGLNHEFNNGDVIIIKDHINVWIDR